jgi:hypothetical protein
MIYRFPPSTRAGSRSIDLSSSNTASTVIPISRKGNNSNQTIGYATSASSANGQHSRSNTIQSRNLVIL